MSPVKSIFKRELASYFNTPVAWVFLVIFLFLAGFTTFQIGAFFESNQASLQAFFSFHIWLYLLLMPAIAMRSWAEERNTGSIELLLTLPITLKDSVLGKFLAAWAFAGIALILTFPMWMTVAYLGEPDHGVIIAGYIGSWLLAGAFLAVSTCMSAISKSQVVAFILSVVVCLLFILLGFPAVLDFFQGIFPRPIVDAIGSLSFFSHFNSIMRGVIDLRDLLYFGLLIGLFLYATSVVIDLKKAN
jgi:ABC-2 type transport system permease protein